MGGGGGGPLPPCLHRLYLSMRYLILDDYFTELFNDMLYFVACMLVIYLYDTQALPFFLNYILILVDVMNKILG